MTRPVTLSTGQLADLPFEEVCAKASSWGFDGLELVRRVTRIEPPSAAFDSAFSSSS